MGPIPTVISERLLYIKYSVHGVLQVVSVLDSGEVAGKACTPLAVTQCPPHHLMYNLDVVDADHPVLELVYTIYLLWCIDSLILVPTVSPVPQPLWFKRHAWL